MKLDAPTLESLDLAGKRVLVRVDFNVPLDGEGQITDDTRIRAALPTLQQIQRAQGQPICLCHFGRPKGQVVESMRVTPIGQRLEELLGTPVLTLKASTGPEVQAAIQQASPETTVLLENVRFHAGETRGDGALAREFAALGDCFVNDAFGASHRDHASVSGIAHYLPAAAGSLLEKEVAAFQRVLEEPVRPLVAILGGAKVSDKLTVIQNLLDRVDSLLIGGGMAYTFLKAQGHPIGLSLVEDEQLDLCRSALQKAEQLGVQLCLPSDHVVADRFGEDGVVQTCGLEIQDGFMGLDIGPQSSEAYASIIRGASTVVWNGPMGVFEMQSFRHGTETVGRALGECEGYTVVGGGDSVAAIHLLGLESSVSHISTGGGASLELLEGKSLPGIAALGAAGTGG